MATLFATGQFFAQAFDAEGSSLMSSLIDQSNISVSVAATDTPATPTRWHLDLDTTADVEGDLECLGRLRDQRRGVGHGAGADLGYRR